MKRLDLLGQTFGRLTVTGAGPGRTKPSGNRTCTWLCRCVCGADATVQTSQLTGGHTTSCGCFRHDLAVAKLTRHGMTYTRTHAAWRSMIRRCHIPSTTNYARYGGRGLQVCQRWRDAFENFHADMGSATTEKHSIDRIDNDKGYDKENCRWATARQQCNNKSNNVILDAFGEKKNITQWASDPRCAVPLYTLQYRWRQGGWKADAAITTPPLKIMRIA